MSYALWLNRRKIYSADEIADNLDLASLCGYFTAGSLTDWLKSHGGEAYAKALEGVSKNDPALKDRLREIFGGQPIEFKQLGSGCPTTRNTSVPQMRGTSLPSAASSLSFSAISSLSAFSSGNFGSGITAWKLRLLSLQGSFNLTSRSYYSYRSFLLNIGFGSGFAGSYPFSGGALGYEWEWEWLWSHFGSFGFAAGSYVYGSFVSALRAFFARNYGSFGSRRFGSWGLGLLSFGSWNKWQISRLLYGSFGSRSAFPGSFGGFAPNGGIVDVIDSDEYDRILMECLFGCRLNGYGYGIHNV